MRTQTQKKNSHPFDWRKMMVRIVAILCALVIIGSAVLAAFW